jgi:hypothetical protein
MRQRLVVSFLCALVMSFAAGLQAADPDPAKVVTVADVAKVLGGKFKVEVPEPGMASFLEEGGDYRQVDVFITTSPTPKLDDLKSTVQGHGEPVDEVPGVGDGAMYRPQGQEAMVEKVAADRAARQLAVVIRNVSDAAKSKEFALALLRLGAGRL